MLNENQRLAQLTALVLVWYQAVSCVVKINDNQRVAQLLHLYWCSNRQFQVLSNENQRVAQLLHLF